MYIHFAYQSPSSPTDCGPQCNQTPIFASFHQLGVLKWSPSDSHVGSTGPLVMGALIPSTQLNKTPAALLPGACNCCAGSRRATAKPVIRIAASSKCGVVWRQALCDELRVDPA